MNTAVIALFVTYQVFYGLLSFYHSSTVRASPEDVATLDAKLWLENTPLAAAATVFLLLVRINGIALLVYLGFKTAWHVPIVLFFGALLAMAVLSAIIRRAFGTALPSLLGFVILPIVGVVLWFVF
jgi:hypothetical protein